jgi:membrane fusion protein (multidrug efflux system)
MSLDEDGSAGAHETYAQEDGGRAGGEDGKFAKASTDKGDTSDNDRGKDQKGAKQDGNQNGGDGDKGEAKPRSKKPLIIIGIVVLVLAIAGFIVWFLDRNQVSTDDAYTDGNTVTMAPKVSGYVDSLYINDNAHIKKGELLLRIDQRDYLTAKSQAEAQLALARAQLKAAEDSLKIARVQYPAQLEAAKAQQQAAAAAAALAQQSYDRQHEVDRRATTQQTIDSSTSQQRSTSADLRSAKAQVAIAALVPEQVQQAVTMVAERQASVQQAQAQLDQALLNLGYTEIRAPSDGFVTMRSVQVGSYVTAGQSLFVLVTPEVWVTANFKESQIGRMREGNKVEMQVDAYSGYKLEGHVQSIQYGTGARFSAFPAENATGNYVKIVQRIPVKIVIDRGLDPDRQLPIGLSVDPVVYFP